MDLLKKNLFFLILLFAFLFRVNGINWDSNFHLHPDERFLTLVGEAIKLPSNISSYFDPLTSTLNPKNSDFTFFVYGLFPVTINKATAVILGYDNYNGFTLQGRFLSALADVLAIVVIYKIVFLFEKKYKVSPRLKYLASFFYAISVLPIQLAHFFAVDTFLNLFMLSSFYFALKYSLSKEAKNIWISGALLGFAIGSKITAFFILPLNLFFIFKDFKKNTRFFIWGLFYFLILYFSVRVVDPYLFENSNLLKPTISQNFINNLKILKSFESKDIWFPPAVQWTGKTPALFAFINLAIFGLGASYSILLAIGIYYILKNKRTYFYPILIWMLVFFIFHSTQFSQSMRYFLPIYPFLAVLAAYSFNEVFKTSKAPKLIALLILIIWPLSFQSIYLNKHTRVAASQWIYQNIENNSLILSEHWDDSLPLRIKDTYAKEFAIQELPVFDPDSEEKWKKMKTLLDAADYYVLSSNRGWGSIMSVPEKYPLMSKFYRDLFAGRTSFSKIKEFTSYPSLKFLALPLEFKDDWSEEAFTVYDHPKVIIFKKRH